MGVPIPPEVQAFLGEPVIAHIATIMKDGSPQATPLWVETDGTSVLVNTTRGRLKEANLQRDPRVALSILSPDNNYRGVHMRGRVTEITEEGAVEQINGLNLKYRGNPNYPLQLGQARVKVVIEPTHITPMGLS
ncbi:MAG: PPOX class F420-dependent oxidoreductase [Chloroflexi bacterium]|nr:PPOX class F420-dependent oxidoreductase [Chloroflexota bacterium]